jgi:sentrin-specific protease 1
MGGRNEKCLDALRIYLGCESQEKRKTTFDFSGWKFYAVQDIPQQMNGSDCGMFTCKFAEYIVREVPITFTQSHMPYFRRRMIYEILKKQLL